MKNGIRLAENRTDSVGLRVARRVVGTSGRRRERPASAPTIVVEVIVEDAKGRPIPNLAAKDVEVVQDADLQAISSFKATSAPGLYEIAYVPRSGSPGPMTIRVLLPGSRVRGPQGGAVKPRVLWPPSPLEAELERILEARVEASDLRCNVAVFRFEQSADGVHQTIAIEVASTDLRFTEAQGLRQGRIQILVRLSDTGGHVVRRIAADRPWQSATSVRVGDSAFERLIWTGHLHLRDGRYLAEVVVFEPDSGRATIVRDRFDAKAPGDGLTLSSVALLQPREFVFVAEHTDDDPLVMRGDPVMPTLDLTLAAGAPSQVRFFVTIYPDAKVQESPALRVELYRAEKLVGSVPVVLPPPDANGEIRYVGLMPTRAFPPASYVLRVVARQGAAQVSEQAQFAVAAGP